MERWKPLAWRAVLLFLLAAVLAFLWAIAAVHMVAVEDPEGGTIRIIVPDEQRDDEEMHL